MKTLISFYILFFFLLSGWLNPTIAYADQTRKPTPPEKEVFTILKQKFPGDILDKNLKTLHELAESSEYKSFLTKTYPVTEPIQGFEGIVDFEATLNKILPPKEHFLTFYTEHFGVKKVDEVETFEHLLIFHAATSFWVFEARKHGSGKRRLKTPGHLQLPSSAKLMHTSLYRKMLETRFGIPAALAMNPQIMTEIIRHINTPITILTKEHLVADAHLINALLERHGNTDGMLWLAIQHPTLFERLRYAFTTPTMLINFVYTAPIAVEAENRKIADMRKRIEQQRGKSNR